MFLHRSQLTCQLHESLEAVDGVSYQMQRDAQAWLPRATTDVACLYCYRAADIVALLL